MPALTRPNTAVTISIIVKFLPTPRWRERLGPCTVKKIQSAAWRSGRTEVLVQHNAEARQGLAGMSPVIQRGRRQRLIHHSVALPISAAFGLRYRHHPMRRWAHPALLAARDPNSGKRPGGMVVWGEWGFGGQIRFSGRRAARLPSLHAWRWPIALPPTNSPSASIPNTGSLPAPESWPSVIPCRRGAEPIASASPIPSPVESMFPRRTRITAPRAWRPGTAMIFMAA